MKKIFTNKFFLIPFIALFTTGLLLAAAFYFRTPLVIALVGRDPHPVIVVSGTWKEMGYQIGSRPDIAKNIRRTAWITRQAYPPEKAQDYFKKVKHQVPQSVLDQMEGIADGMAAALDISYNEAWNDIVALNFASFKGCTAFAVSSPHGSFLAHNTDFDYLYILGGAIMIYRPDAGQGQAFVSFGSPVFTGVALGQNISGLAVVYNAAFPSERRYGLPPFFMVRKVLQECSSVEEAVAAFQSFIDSGGQFGYIGGNLTLMNFKTGRMARIELGPDRMEVDRGTALGDKQFVVATNHYRLMPERNQRDDFSTSSYARFERARMLLAIEDKITVDSVLNILSDHDDQDHGTDHTICRHKDRNEGTCSTIFFDERFVLYYTLENPCRYKTDPSVLYKVPWKKILEKKKTPSG